jgi:hypothetical protein
VTLLASTLREIRERSREHFKHAPLSTDQAQADIRDLLDYVDDLIAEVEMYDDES